MQAEGTVLGPHTHTPAPTARGWRTPTARLVGGQSGEGLRSASARPVARDMAGRNEDIPDAVSQLRHSHHDGVPHVRDLHLGAYTPSPPPREWGLVLVPAPGTAQLIPPPYALEMCLHLPVGVHYYRACSGADPWPRDVLSLVGAVHCLQVAGSHQLQLCRKGLPHLLHLARAPPRGPPTIPTRPCLHHSHRPHPGQCLGDSGHVPPPAPPQVGARPASRPPRGRGPQANPALRRRRLLPWSPPCRPRVTPPGRDDPQRADVPAT